MDYKAERKRIVNPYGMSTRDLVSDKTRNESRYYGTQERSGGPYRSDKDEKNERPEKYEKSDRPSRDERQERNERRGERRDVERRDVERRDVERRDVERYRDRSRSRSPVRTRSPARREYIKKQEKVQSSESENLEENFEILSKEAILPLETIREINMELSQKFDTPYQIVEAIVDPIHDTSVQFAKSKNVNKVITFVGKKNPELLEKLSVSPKITVIEDTFNFVPPEVKNPFVLFLYPYWIINVEDTKNILFKDIPIATGGTFKDILTIEKPDLFAFVVPKSLKIPDNYGDKKEIDLEKGKLVLIEPKATTSSMFKRGTSKATSYEMNEKEWDKQFLSFIRKLLSNIAKDETIDKIVNQKTLPIWKKAFTHETIDLNENYEQLETIGDRVLELTFLKYLLRRYPDLTPQEITNLKSKYMSKMYQGTTASQLGLGDWIRVGNDIYSIHILEDVYESLFGALFEIADREIYDGAGYVLALKLQTKIFDENGFDLSDAQGHPRSQIKEIFEMLKLDVPDPEEYVSERGTSIRILITPDTRDALMTLEKMKSSTPLLLGEGFGPYKTSAINLAYSNALEYLKSLGITRDWAESQKQLLDLMVPELEPYVNNALKRMEKEGYIRFYVRTPRASVKTGNVVVQLVGEYYDKNKEKEQKMILVSGKYPDIQTGKVEVVKQYALGK
jgi:dsRNA-specific ribonuclease